MPVQYMAIAVPHASHLKDKISVAPTDWVFLVREITTYGLKFGLTALVNE